MYLSWSQFTLLAALIEVAHPTLVESVDGSFVPWSFFPRAPTDGSIAVRLKNNNDLAYLATVVMGNPPQHVQMCASLSQNYISVASPPSGANDSTYYQPASSTSYVPGSGSATVQTISGGSVTGRFAGETCSLQSVTSADKFEYNASVVLTDGSVTNDLYPSGAKGILGYGLNLPADSPPGASLLGKFLPANFTRAVCGIEINHISDPVPDGIFTMGAVDSAAYTGDFTDVIVPADSQTSWSIAFDHLTCSSGGGTQNVSGSVASIDLYHSGIQISTAMASQIYSGVPGSQAVSSTVWSLPCNSTFSLTLTFGGKPFTMSERDTIVKSPNGTCTGVVTGGAQGLAQVGAPFMRNVYTQFGAQKASNGSLTFFVGFATKSVRQSTTSSTTSSAVTGPTTSTVPTSTSTSTSGAPWKILQDVGLLSTLAVASIVAALFM